MICLHVTPGGRSFDRTRALSETLTHRLTQKAMRPLRPVDSRGEAKNKSSIRKSSIARPAAENFPKS
jgi:hypothetical protein